MEIGKKTDFQDFLSSLSSYGDKHLGILLNSKETRISFSHQSSDDEMKYFTLEEFNDDLVRSLFQRRGKDFKTVDLYSADKEVTLIPHGLFSEKNVGLCLEGVFGKSRKDHLYSFIDCNQIYSLFRIERDILEALKDCFPQLKTHHLIDTVITKTWVDRSFSDGFLLRIHLEKEALFVLAFRGKDLTLFNIQTIGEPTDIIYHVLNSVQGLGIDYSTVDLSCSGDLVDRTEGFELLRSYCPRVRSSVSDSETSEQKDFILDNHRICEL